MNFMSGRPGFCEEITGTAGMPSSSSSSSASSSPSSSSLQHKGLPRYSYRHQHQEAYGGGRASQLPNSSPTTNGSGGVNDSDDHMLVRRGGESSSAGEAHVVIEREHMFDKVVTPSDVGKLNRLVIPKQHAEKYFPLDSSANEKGLLLNFEDRNGKSWWFRYSYWNSSQSYVMTKGWSRFVKDKKLDAGDTVSFQRGVGELGKDRLFIDWRRRTDAAELPHPIPTLSIPHQFSFHGPVHPWNPLILQPPSRDYSNFLIQANSPISTQHLHYRSCHHYPTGYCPYAQNSVVNGNTCTPGSIVYPRSARGVGIRAGPGVLGQEQAVDLIHAQGRSGVGVEQMVIESIPVVQGKSAPKRLRLFGVNMDCPISESDECDRLSSTSPPQGSVMPTIQHLPPAPFNSSHSAVNPNCPELRPYNDNDDKGKDSVSLDLDI